jgi:cholesterol transport system auxiliary component
MRSAPPGLLSSPRGSPQSLRAFLLFVPMLAGCSGGLFGTASVAPVAYVLPAAAATAAPATATAAAPRDLVLSIARVRAAPGYDGDRILILRADNSLESFAASRWAEPLPAVAQSLAVQSLRATHALRAVNDDLAPFGADYTLNLTIRRFDAQYVAGATSAPRILVAFDVLLGRRSDRNVVAAFGVEGSAQASDNRMGAVVAAFAAAANDALRDAGSVALRAIDADLAAAAEAAAAAAAAAAQNGDKPVPSISR